MNTEGTEPTKPKDRLKFTREQLNSALQQPVRIELPSGATLNMEHTSTGVWVYYFIGTRLLYNDEVYRFSTLAQILRALVQEGSKIPEEDQDYLKGLLPKERKKRPPRRIKDPDACPFCGGLGRINAAESRGRYRWYVECSDCMARTADTRNEPTAWELWRRRRS